MLMNVRLYYRYSTAPGSEGWWYRDFDRHQRATDWHRTFIWAWSDCLVLFGDPPDHASPRFVDGACAAPPPEATPFATTEAPAEALLGGGYW
jgi:hypothetical protein